jgi:Leucine-rich repeat (LRR) protein
LDDVDGHLPLEIGNLTELISIDIDYSDLSAGPVPDSIGLCTKLVKIRLQSCKLEGEFPKVQTLKSRYFLPFNEIEFLSLQENSFGGSISDWIGSLNLLEYLDLGYNKFSGELPIGICDLESLEELKIYDNYIDGILLI